MLITMIKMLLQTRIFIRPYEILFQQMCIGSFEDAATCVQDFQGV